MSNTYKKACGSLRLLSKLREHVTSDAAFKIYQMMILPMITYSGMIRCIIKCLSCFVIIMIKLV